MASKNLCAPLLAAMALTALSGCGTVQSMLGPTGSKGASPPVAEDGTSPPVASGDGAKDGMAASGSECDGKLADVKGSFDKELKALQGKPATSVSNVKRTVDDLGRLRKRVSAEARSLGCGDAGEAVANDLIDRGYDARVSFARKALEAGDARAARSILFNAYVRNDREDRPAYRELSRAIGKAYDAQRLTDFQRAGALGEISGSKKMCVFSDKPFPKNAGATPKPVFKSHVEGNKLYVLCRLPKPAASYERDVEPTFVIMVGLDKGNTIFPLSTKNLGPPKSHGNVQFLEAEFEVPPPREDFAEVKRHVFDVYLQHFYKVRQNNGVLRDKKVHVAQSSVFWHR
jgi:hypothetical protein